MITDKQLTIIIPSYKDIRILAAIESVRSFDDSGVVKILVVDGDSGTEFCERVRAVLAEGDVLISEADAGIFDGLNKGLDNVDTPYLGWLGSDDFFTEEVKASEVIDCLRDVDLFVGDLVIFSRLRSGGAITPGFLIVGLQSSLECITLTTRPLDELKR